MADNQIHWPVHQNQTASQQPTTAANQQQQQQQQQLQQQQIQQQQQAALASSVAMELAHNGQGIAWFNKTSVRHFMRLCSILSLLSVCASTSKTYSYYPKLMLITFIVDIITGVVFTIEMIFKIHQRGFLKGSNPYARDRWCQFDAVMVLFIWISILLQIFEIFNFVRPYSVLSVLRSPRPLILIRFIRVFLKFSMPKSRIKQIFKRSSQQIYNVSSSNFFFLVDLHV